MDTLANSKDPDVMPHNAGVFDEQNFVGRAFKDRYNVQYSYIGLFIVEYFEMFTLKRDQCILNSSD